MDTKDTHEIIKALKQEFFAYRNGMLGDLLRSNGDCHKMILGLNLPQIQEITSRCKKNKEVAEELWENTNHRECRMAAPFLYPTEEFSIEDAQRWCDSIENIEIADTICHKLIRYLPYAQTLVEKYYASDNYILRYTALRLLLNLLLIEKFGDKELAKRIAEESAFYPDSKIKDLTQSILEEC